MNAPTDHSARAHELAVRAGVPEIIRDAYAPELQRLADLAAADRTDTLHVIEARQDKTHTLVSVCVAIAGAGFALDLLRAVSGAL